VITGDFRDFEAIKPDFISFTEIVVNGCLALLIYS